MGKDVGIISYNETPLKGYLELQYLALILNKWENQQQRLYSTMIMKFLKTHFIMSNVIHYKNTFIIKLTSFLKSTHLELILIPYFLFFGYFHQNSHRFYNTIQKQSLSEKIVFLIFLNRLLEYLLC